MKTCERESGYVDHGFCCKTNEKYVIYIFICFISVSLENPPPPPFRLEAQFSFSDPIFTS
jgi:hypothetical protein